MHKLLILIASVLPWAMATIEGSVLKFRLLDVTVIPVIGILYTLLALFKPKRFLMGTSRYTKKYQRVSVNDVPGIFMTVTYALLCILFLRKVLEPTLAVAIVQSILIANLMSYTFYTIFNVVRGVTIDDR